MPELSKAGFNLVAYARAMADLRLVFREIRFDEYGTPDRKLPACLRCGEDEVICSQHDCSARCLRCDWTCYWQRRIDA